MSTLDTHYCFGYVRFFTKLVGLSPFVDSQGQRFRRCFIHMYIISSIVMQLWLIATKESSLDAMLPSVNLLMNSIIVTIKYLTCCIKSKPIQEVYTTIGINWRELKCEKERDIMEKYCYEGWLCGAICTWLTIITTSLIFFLTTFLPYFHGDDLNFELRSKWIPSQLSSFDGGIEERFRFLYFEIFLFLAIVIFITGNLLYLAPVYQACGMLSVVGYRFEHTFDDIRGMSDAQKASIIRDRIAKTVEYHCKCINFISLVGSCFVTSLFIQSVVVIAILSFKLYHIYKYASLMKDMLAAAFILDTIHILIHLSQNFYFGEKLADCYRDLYYRICNGCWYEASIGFQKMLQIVIQQCSEPFYYSIPGFLNLSYEFYTQIWKASFSCFTVMRTTQSFN